VFVLDVQSNPLAWSGPDPAQAPCSCLQERAQALPATAWQPITVAEGAQGQRSYLFACEPVYDNRDKRPGIPLLALYRKNLDGREPRYYYAHAPAATPLVRLAQVGASRWNIETELKTNKSDIGLDEYEARSWQGWHHHMTMCLLASAFLLSLQQGSVPIES